MRTVFIIVFLFIGLTAFAGLVIIGGVLAVHALLFWTERDEIAKLTGYETKTEKIR
jgi:hypothetical protein